jgi:hypothetical protein
MCFELNYMRRGTRILIAVILTGSAVAPRVASAQRGQPRTAFAVADFAKLRWLEGSWAGTAPGERNYYQRCHAVDDTTIDMSFYADSAFTHQTVSGRLYLSVGRIFHSMGPELWGATHVDANSVYFVPQANAQNTYVWTRKSKDEWTATLRSGFAGQDRVTVYTMRRAQP